MPPEPQPGEVYWLDDYPQKKGGVKGRPVVIISRAEWTAYSGVVVTVPVTSWPDAEWATVKPELVSGGLPDAKSVITPELVYATGARDLGRRLGVVSTDTVKKARKLLEAVLA